MGSKPTWSATFASCLLGAFVLHAEVMPRAAYAQRADAGVEKAAVPPPAAAPPAAEPPAAEPPPAAAEAPPANAPSGVLPKVINPAQLSESVRARLAERAGGQHPSSLPEPAAGSGASAPHRSRTGASEPLRRGQARMRVQAVETDEGVTLLSNRIQLSESRLSAAVARRSAPEPEAPTAEEAPVVEDSARITETHSLRPTSSRSTKAASGGAGLGWLLWPFVLFVTIGAVVGTLWFRRKTE
jgi:hypothetical protein